MSHARLSPSSAGRWYYCPGSIQMESQFPDNAGRSALDGEASHWAGSELLEGRAHHVGETAPNGVILDMEMVSGAAEYAQAVQVAAQGAPLVIEQRIGAPSIHEDCWGTPDCWFYRPETAELHVFDYKYGWKIVDVIENKQLIIYAVGALELLAAQWQRAYETITPYITVVFHIVQPRPYHMLGSHREWRVLASDLHSITGRLWAAAKNAMGENPLCKTGSQCEYCRARHACDALRRSAYAAFQYTEHAAPHMLNAEELGAELAILERAMEAIKHLHTGITAQAVGIINGGGIVPGWTVERGPGRTVWSKPAAEIFALGDMLGKDLRKPQEAITPAQARKVGLPAEVVTAYAETPLGEAKLIRSDRSITAQVFGPVAAARAAAGHTTP